MEFLKTLLLRLPEYTTKRSTKVETVDMVFMWHYILTAQMLFLFSLFNVLLLMFDWIQCYSSTLHIPGKMLNIYCWMQNTFVLPQRYDDVKVGTDIAHPGIDKSTDMNERQYVTYYQWIPLVLLFQGILFKVPHILWKKLKHETIVNLVVGYQSPIAKNTPNSISTSDDEINIHLKLTVNYIFSKWKHRKHYWWYLFFVLLNLINVIGNIILLTKLFNTNVTNITWKSLAYFPIDYVKRSDVLMAVFPRMVKCSYYDYGVGGSVQVHDVLCVLPYNVYNEKLFALLLSWFFILAILTGLELIYWTFMLLPKCRYSYIFKPLKKLLSKAVIHKCAQDMLDEADYNNGDWFLIYLLCKNMHEVHLKKVMESLNEIVPKKKRKSAGSSNSNDSQDTGKLI
ncbi:hypothetical protein CHUAL_004852 [Chamberlinius hualienensis]